MHQCAHNVEPWPTMDQTYVIIIPVVSMNSGRRGNYTDVIKMMKYVLILFCFIHCVTRTTCRRMETMAIEDQLNIFAGIDNVLNGEADTATQIVYFAFTTLVEPF